MIVHQACWMMLFMNLNSKNNGKAKNKPLKLKKDMIEEMQMDRIWKKRNMKDK